MSVAVSPARTRHVDRVAFAWGCAEAVLFFVIPDVFLSLVAIRFGFRAGWRAALATTAGAVVGGLAVYLWAAFAAESVFAVMNLLPAVDLEMIESVRRRTAEHGTVALLGAPWQGVPYKLHAAAAGELGLGALNLALVTIPGRLARFAASVAVAAYLRWFFARWLPRGVMLGAWALFWVVTYGVYWFG